MNHVTPRRPRSKASPIRRRDDVEALIALVSLDQGTAQREATVASALALLGRTRGDIASSELEIAATRDALQRLERSGAEAPEIETLRGQLRDQRRGLARLTRLAEETKTEAAAASAELRERCADLPVRRGAITSRIPRATLADYENALRHGLLPAAVATSGRVCWGCFHRLSGAVTAEFDDAQAFVCCPHCERVLFNPDWIERR